MQQLVSHLTDFKTDSDTFRKLVSSSKLKLRFTKFPSPDESKITKTIYGLAEKLEIHRQYKKAEKLLKLFHTLKLHRQLDVVDFLLNLSHSPIQDRLFHVELERDKQEEIQREKAKREEIVKNEVFLCNMEYKSSTIGHQIIECSESESETEEVDNINQEKITEKSSNEINQYSVVQDNQNQDNIDFSNTNLNTIPPIHLIKPYWENQKENEVSGFFDKHDPSTLASALRFHGLFSNEVPQALNDGHYIPEYNVIRESLFCLRGHSSFMYQVKKIENDIEIEVIPIMKMTLNHLTRSSLSNWMNDFCWIARKLLSLREFLDAKTKSLDSKSGTFTLLKIAIQDYLTQVDQYLSDVEYGYLNENMSIVSLMDFLPKLDEIKDNLTYIQPLVKSVFDFASMESNTANFVTTYILDTLWCVLEEYSHDENFTNSNVYCKMKTIFMKCISFYVYSMENWISTGKLDDPLRETFMSSQYTDEKSQEWKPLRFNGQSASIPVFMKGLASKIYDVGELQYLLIKFSQEQSSTKSSSMKIDIFQRLLLDDEFKYLPFNKRWSLIQSAFRRTLSNYTSGQFSMFIQGFKGGIQQHFQLLQSTLLMMNGDVMYTVVQAISEKILKHSLTELDLNMIMSDALDQFEVDYGFSSENMGSLIFYLLPVNIQNGNENYSILKWLDRIQVSFEAPWPFNFIIKPDHLKIYSQVFQQLFKIKLLKRLIEVDCFPPRPMDGRKLGKTMGLSTQSGSYTQRACLRISILHFINALENHLQIHIINDECVIFNEKWKECWDLRSLLLCHSEFIEKIRDKSLLNQKAKLLLNCIERVFQIALEFRDYCLVLDEAELRVSAIVATPSKKGLSKFQSEPNLRSMTTLSHYHSKNSQLNKLHHDDRDISSRCRRHDHRLDEETMNIWIDFHKRFSDLKRFLVSMYEELSGRGLEHFKFFL